MLDATASAVSGHGPATAGRRSARRLGQWRDRLNFSLVIGALLVTLLVCMSVLAPWLAPHDPNALGASPSLLPLGSPGHLLGTDDLGRDQLSRILYGGRITLMAGLLAALASTAIAIILGVVAGYLRGPTDAVLMRLMDIIMSFPFILMAILIVAVAGPSIGNALSAIAIANVPYLARMIRSEAMRIRSLDYVAAAEALGASRIWVIRRHILPNVMPMVMVVLFVNVGWMISQTSALSFLGLGAQPPTADWGTMLATAQAFMATNGAVAVAPGVMVVLAVVAFNFLGNGLGQLLEVGGRNR